MSDYPDDCPMCGREVCLICAPLCEHDDPTCARCCRIYRHEESAA